MGNLTKQQKTGIVIGIIIILIANPGNFLSVLSGASKLDCSGGGNPWSCSATGLSGADLGSLRINEPTNANDYINTLCSTMLFVSNGQCRSQRSDEPSATWRSEMGALVNQFLVNKILIIEGSDEQGNQFRTYGICPDAIGRGCSVIDPFGDDRIVIASSIEIHFKDGGYTDDNICPLFNLNCQETINVFRYEPNLNICTLNTIFPDQRTENDFNTFEECNANVIGETQEPKGEVVLFIIIGFIVIGGLVFIFNKIK